MLWRLLRERCEVRKLIGDVGTGKLRPGYGGEKRAVEAIPFSKEVVGAVGFRAKSFAEAIRFVTNLKSQQPQTKNLVHGSCLAHRILDGALSEVKSIKARPVRRVKEIAQIS